MRLIYANLWWVRTLRLSLAAVIVVSLAACSDANQPNAGQNLVEATTCAYPSEGEPVRAVDPPPTTDVPTEGEVTATLEMTAGKVTITMDRSHAPCTVNSFTSLAEQGYFDDTVCHRLVDTGIFILQCGDPSATGKGGPGYTIADELTGQESYPRGTVAMAKRTPPNTGGSQFFLVFADTELPPEYTVFGTMDETGIETVAGIAAQGVDAADQTSPIAEAKITQVTLG